MNLRLTIRAQDRAIFDDLTTGRKTVETRAATPKYQAVQPGDTLTFVCGSDLLTKKVASAQRFADVDELFRYIPFRRILPAAANAEAAKQAILKFPGNREKITSFGIMAFNLGDETKYD